MNIAAIKSDLVEVSSPEKAKHSARFFKTGKGEYGEGDKFLGIVVPDQRKIAKKYYKDISLSDLRKLLSSKYHEHRLTALFMLVYMYEKADEIGQKEIYDFYLDNLKWVNNWDLVDSSAHKIVGAYLLDKPGVHRKILYNLARSRDLWERRVSVISTFAFINDGQFEDALKIAEILVNDDQDLIHKAVGWMLRELGKIDQVKEENFLRNYGATMPRTMLRYAIEKFSAEKKKYYMNL